jgi:hypothetical protein
LQNGAPQAGALFHVYSNAAAGTMLTFDFSLDFADES